MLDVAKLTGNPVSVCVNVMNPCNGHIPVVDATARPISCRFAVLSATIPICDNDATFDPAVDCDHACTYQYWPGVIDTAPDASGKFLVFEMLVQMLVLPALFVDVDVLEDRSVPDPHDI
jgi:hypothetical protein